jgi:hypothetical protein
VFLDYAHLSANYQGWSLTELRAMSVRERRYWCELAMARRRQENAGD